MKYRSTKIEIEQNTPEWEAWRSDKLGASEVPAMMGESSYKNRAKLLELKKTGKKEEFNDFTLRLFKDGHVFEEMMRPIISMEYELDLEKACYEDARTGFISASYDGLDEAQNIGWECKHSKKEMEFIKAKGVPSLNYYGQVQAQIYVKDLDQVIFTAGQTAENRHSIEVLPDLDYQKRFLNEAIKFREQWKSEKIAPLDFGPLVKKAMRLKRLIAKLKKDESVVMDQIKKIDWDENFQYENAIYLVSSRSSSSFEKDRLFLDLKKMNIDLNPEDYTIKSKSKSITIKELKN